MQRLVERLKTAWNILVVLSTSFCGKIMVDEMSEEKEGYCALCGEPMPPGEEMFMFHGYSGPCPKPPLPKEFSVPGITIEAALASEAAESQLVKDLVTLLERVCHSIKEPNPVKDKALRFLEQKRLSINKFLREESAWVS